MFRATSQIHILSMDTKYYNDIIRDILELSSIIFQFDFRIYVLVTSINPLRIYLYKDGLVRFATEKFSTSEENLSNMFIHLTNFTVNKKGLTVKDYPPGCQVNKENLK